ncbi:tectonic-2-like isoform X2 [Lineus longissimus]
MAYNWTGSGTNVEIRCVGVSQNAGNQYLPATSLGVSATFTFEKGSIKLLPAVQLVRSRKFQSQLVLDTALSNQAQEVTFDCTLEQFNDTSTLADAARNPICRELSVIRVPTANTTAAPTGGPTVPTVATTAATNTGTNTSIQWTLKTQKFIFKAGQHYKTVEAERSAWPASTTAELLLLSCCAPSGSDTSPKYINKTAAAMVLSYLEPSYEVNVTAAALASSSVETEIKNPAFVNLSPCPCDLLKGACDVNCCCDTDCTADMNKTMICIPGILGGERTNGPEDRTCKSTRYYKEDWWMVMCVYYENNAYLGLYYNNQKGIQTKQTYASTVPAKRSAYSWEEKDKRNLAENVAGIGYKQGLSIQTNVPGSNGKVGILTLPQRVLTGQCQRTAPVQYLTDGNSNCNIKMTQATCEEVGGPFNARSYITASSISTPPCPSYPGVMMQYDGTAYTTVSTNYFCTTDPNLRGYVKNLEDVQTVSTRSLFSTTIVDYASCEFNKHGQFVCPNSTTVTTPATAAPTRCAYDDGLNLPPGPTFDVTNKICRNAVLDVEYKFYWAGKRIVNLTANFIMGDVPVEMSYTKTVKTYSTDANNVSQETQTVSTLSYPSEVTQKYSIKYTHDYNFTLLQDANVDATNTTGQYSPRSGYPGYEFGKPIIAGIGYYNTTTTVTDPVDYSQGNGIYYYKVDADGLCTTATKQPATYDEEVLSNCAIYLTVGDFDNCDELRKSTLLHLDSMMPANYLSQIGYVDDSNTTTVDQHWVQIVRSNLSDTVLPVPMNATARNASIEAQIRRTGYPNGTHDIFNVIDKIKGRCSSIPTGIHISIFSAYTGNINGREIHRIVGAAISYTLSTLEMRCVGSQGTACKNNSAETQRFTMTATVDFSDAPRNSSYGIRLHQFQGKCWEEKCNSQLFYPFTKYYTQESYQYTLAWFLVFLLFLVPTFMVTRPWW